MDAQEKILSVGPAGVKGKNFNLARLPRNFLPGARQLVELLPADLDRGIHRRHLLLRAEKARQDSRQRLRGNVCGLLVQHRAGDVLRVGHDAGTQRGKVGLVRVLKKFHRARRTAQKDRQDARGHGVERAAVPNAFFVENAAQLGDHILRGPSGGLVHDQNSVCHQTATPDARRTRRMASFASAMPPGTVAPAAAA